MEIEGSTQVVAKKVWNIIRVMFFMLRKGIAKSKIMAEFNLMLKRGKKALVNNLMLNHHYIIASFTGRSNHNHATFISPRDYEFSCSNSPAVPFHAHKNHRFSKPSQQHHDVSTLSAVQKVLEILNNDATNSPFPAFAKSPLGKQLRVTDSPFPLKDDGDSQVDVAAEEFIKKFYKDLNLQKKMAYLESPYHTSWSR
ncbi:uncharacterized protein LOC114176015 [Vigna unguiculata]|uniref:Avr9/Cf-9 rapidly elicited protein 146 n=1 Tax=Vigna unguiculata TaxID=3917 RepID=A0A4D6LA41_VIGUN|nr:uncharacterized protein LOC114176015 [Vigna unguiculata]QCD85245.1 hypothetical protein DEO72_LG2g5605 [Vigna unguiculata]